MWALNRLFTITVSESTYLIWRIRCDWKITPEGDPSKKITETEIVNRWVKMVAERIKLDILSSDSQKYNAKQHQGKQS